MPLHLIWSALGNQGKEIWQCVLSGSCDFQLELRSAHLVNYPSKCFSSSIDMYTEKAMAPHSSTLAWKIPWTEEPGRLQSMGSLRVGHNWTTSLSFFNFHALGKKMATHSSVIAWRIPGMGEPGGLPSMGSHRVGHNWSDLAAAAVSFLTWWFQIL